LIGDGDQPARREARSRERRRHAGAGPRLARAGGAQRRQLGPWAGPWRNKSNVRAAFAFPPFAGVPERTAAVAAEEPDGPGSWPLVAW